MEDDDLVAVVGDFSDDDDEWDTQETNESARSFGDETENGGKSQPETYEEGIQRAWKSGGDLQTHSSIPFPMRRFMSAEPSLIELNLTMIHNTTLPDTEIKKEDGEELRQISNWMLRRKIGSGTGGDVYLGIHEDTNQKAAIKLIPKPLFEKYSEEYKVMAQVQHKHVISFYEVVEKGSFFALIMQYAMCGDLFDYIARSKGLSHAEARRLFKQLLSAMTHLHAHNFIHRDIKPENIFLDEDQNVLLGDFGYSTPWSSFVKHAKSYGSLHYAAPEILDRKPYVGPEVDMWSLGACLFTMVTAQFPFAGPNDGVVVEKIVRGQWNRKHKAITPDLSDLLNRLLQPTPIKRATLLDCFEHPWVTHKDEDEEEESS